MDKALNILKNKSIAEMIRVNQAGEYGAKRIYEGQIAALNHHPQKQEIEDMYTQELIHLEYFNKEISNRKVRPTMMQPLWSIGGYLLGFISGKMGLEAAMACTAAVEEVIDDHYAKQIERLSGVDHEKILLSDLIRFREEEIEHKKIGLQHSSDSPRYVYKAIIKSLTRLAIKISEKI